MTAASNISALLLKMPTQDRAMLAVELIDSLGDTALDDDDLATLAEARDTELEAGTVTALSYDEFVAGVRRPSQLQ